MSALKLGRGTDDGVQVGPLIDEPSRNKVDELVQEAVDRGTRVLVGAQAVSDRGWFYAPTVLAEGPPEATLLNEEVFGPVAPIVTFRTTDEAIGMANDTVYGLVAYAYTRDLATTVQLAEGLETGMVGINQGIVSNPAAPFGGVKQSGFGREERTGRHRGVPRDEVRRDLSLLTFATATRTRASLLERDVPPRRGRSPTLGKPR